MEAANDAPSRRRSTSLAPIGMSDPGRRAGGSAVLCCGGLAAFASATTMRGSKSLARGRSIRRRCSIGALFTSAALSPWGAAAADLPSRPPPAASTGPAQQADASCFASLYDYLKADPDDCPLSWHGVTLYGRLDYGLGYELARRPVQRQLSQRGSNASSRRTAIERFTRSRRTGSDSRISASRARSRSPPTGRSSSTSRAASIPTPCSGPTGRSRWSRTIRPRSTRRPPTAIRAAPGNC